MQVMGLVHVMGLQTCMGIRVCVRWVWVWVWVEFKVPAQNLYPYGRFGRYIPNWVSNYLLLLSHTNKATSTPSTMVIPTSIDFFPSTPSCHHLHSTTSTRMLIHTPRRTNERTTNKRGGTTVLNFQVWREGATPKVCMPLSSACHAMLTSPHPAKPSQQDDVMTRHHHPHAPLPLRWVVGTLQGCEEEACGLAPIPHLYEHLLIPQTRC